jgi:NADH-quinone oxidoreductase subunit D
MSNKFFQPDRSKYPSMKDDGTLDVDLSSQKYTKLWLGPNHPGVTGNMAVELTLGGDEIVEAKTHVGYLHRGFEKLIERRLFVQGFPTSIRMCVAEPDTNEYLIARSTEELSGLTGQVPEMAEWLRTLVLEMARLQGLLRGVPGQAGTYSLGIGVQWGVYLRDLILDRFEELTGARVYHMFIIAGGVRGLLPSGFKKRMEENLVDIDDFIIRIRKLIFHNSVFKSRAVGQGVIPKDWIDKYGIVGTNARASGVKRDVRKDNPYLKYSELDFDPPTATDGDIYSRTWVRWQELVQTVDLIRQIMAKMPEKGDIRGEMPNALHWKIPKGETYVKLESGRGEYGMYYVTDGTSKPRRVNLRGPSYTHAIAVLEKMLINTNIADVHATMVSLQSCPPEIER